jgi:endonuclease/exonuclease/phosphatase family metal-dependent hydrolase
LVADIIKVSDPDIIGLQEADSQQVQDLVGSLIDYASYGVGSEEGYTGSSNAILVKKSRFDIIARRTIWLSPTPEQISVGWDAHYNRTLTIVLLRDKLSGKQINYYNSHFDNMGSVARLQSALMVGALIDSQETSSTILTGDFNGRPGFDAYLEIAKRLNDTAVTSVTPHTGGQISFNGFGKEIYEGNKLDYIFASRDFSAKTSEIITRLFDGHYPSDHFPVIAEIAY